MTKNPLISLLKSLDDKGHILFEDVFGIDYTKHVMNFNVKVYVKVKISLHGIQNNESVNDYVEEIVDEIKNIFSNTKRTLKQNNLYSIKKGLDEDVSEESYYDHFFRREEGDFRLKGTFSAYVDREDILVENGSDENYEFVIHEIEKILEFRVKNWVYYFYNAFRCLCSIQGNFHETSFPLSI